MSDAHLRQLERVAAQGDREAVLAFLIALGRAGDRGRQIEASAAYVCKRLTRKEALLIAGWGMPIGHAQAAYVKHKKELFAGFVLDWAKFHPALVRVCRDRCHEEWDPLRALGVLKQSKLVRAALGLKQMPKGTGKELKRLRARREERSWWRATQPSCGPDYLRSRLRARREIEAFEGACGALERAVMEHELAIQEEDRRNES